jgi:hypothetical protein
MVEEEEACFGEVARVFEVDRIRHRTDEPIEAAITRGEEAEEFV